MSKIREMDKKLLLANAEALINKLNKFEGFLDGIDASFLVDEKTVAEIEFRLGAIKFINDKYDDVFIRLTASSVHCDIMSSDDFFDKYTSLSIRASTFLNSKTSKPHASLSSGRSLNARLPKIELPIFNGNIMEFKSYNEIFTALVHNNSNLTDIERFLHLKASLKGPAGDIISNMQPTGENYHIAFELLVDRYNNPKLTIQNHVKEIFDLKPITRDNAKDLRKLHDDLSMHLRALENFSVPIDQCVVFISHILISKFDRNTQIEFGKFKTGFVPTLNEINNFLEKRCQLLEEIDANKCNTSAPSNTNPKISFPANKSNNFRQSFIVADDTIICYHCNSHQHYIQQCPSFLSFSIKQRFDRVTELNLCKNCLRHVKGISSCRSKNTCRVCRKKHNSCILNKFPLRLKFLLKII